MKKLLSYRGAVLALGAFAAVSFISSAQDAAPEKLWFLNTNRHAKASYDVTDADHIKFGTSRFEIHYTPESGKEMKDYTYRKNGAFLWSDPGRIVYKPSNWNSNDYTKETSRWCYQRSMESEHFIVFWDKDFGADPTKAKSGYSFNPKTLLNNGEKCFKVYAEELGFIEPGNSATDDYKIHMYVYYQTDWKAEGSGYDHKVGSFNVSPGAVDSRSGQTVAHEIGHTFQYLVKCDLGEPHGFDYGYGANASGGNGWWESCANWQAYRVYPNLKFEQDFYAAYKGQYHLNLMHETLRYQNMFIQDWWVQKHGDKIIGRLWREAERPEDPVEAYMRITGTNFEDFTNETYEYCARLATWDIDGIRNQGKNHIGELTAKLHESAEAEGWWEPDADYCPENFGYNIIAMRIPEAGTVVKADFKGIAGADGYRKIKVDKAGWRYGFVAYTANGERVYSPTQSDAEGTAEITVPEGCRNLWMIVMGAPKEYWRHAWDDNASNDEQWPYRVKFENSSPDGMFRTYGEYPADYERKDAVVKYNAELKYNSSSYTSVRVQYDMDEISKALGLSTEQMKAIKVGAGNQVRFVGISSDGSFTEKTTTSTSSSTCYGHWFDKEGNVCGYGSDAIIFAEMYPDKYGCYVGQYPGRLKTGQPYVVRQGIVYTDDAGKEYKAVMEVNLKVIP